MKENITATKTFDFALSIITLFIELKKENEFIISKQIIRSGTSIGANVEEAIAAQSRKDFINKMSIASKEARETKYWLRLIDKSNLTTVSISNYLIEIEHIINIITKIIKTSQEPGLQ
jgi:four helix bundle protein